MLVLPGNEIMFSLALSGLTMLNAEQMQALRLLLFLSLVM